MRKVQVGDVYRAKATGPRGWRNGTRYWMVVAITTSQWNNENHHMLGLDKDWNIVSAVSYGGHVMPNRKLVFRVKNVGQFQLTRLR